MGTQHKGGVRREEARDMGIYGYTAQGEEGQGRRPGIWVHSKGEG